MGSRGLWQRLKELSPLPAELDLAFKCSVPKAHTFLRDYEKKAENRVPMKAGVRRKRSAVPGPDLAGLLARATRKPVCGFLDR